MSSGVRIPVKIIDGARWGELSFLSDQHLICGETVRMKQENFSLAGQHRVRLYSFKKNVHWKIPDGIELDVTGVSPATPPPRRLPRR